MLRKAPAACAEVVLEPRKIKMNTFSVAGFQYYQGWEIIHDIREGETVALVPEPDNPHDWYAVEMFKDGVKLGYVPRTDNKHISRLLGKQCGSSLRNTQRESSVAFLERGYGQCVFDASMKRAPCLRRTIM